MAALSIFSVVAYVDDNTVKTLINKCDCVAVGSVITFNAYFIAGGDICVDAELDATFKIVNTSTGSILLEETVTGEDLSSNYYYNSPQLTITEPGQYEISIEATACDESYTSLDSFKVCQAATVEYLSCGKYRFTNTLAQSVVLSAQTPAMVSTEDYEFQNVEVEANSYYDFTLTDPGIYILTYTYEIENVKQTFSIQVNFFCTIEACLTKLITQVLCATEEDPCCKECNEQEKKKSEALRYELNKLMALYGYYLALNFYQSIVYLGVFNLTTETLAGLIELDNVVQKIIKLTSSCGPAKCAEDTITVVNCGCS